MHCFTSATLKKKNKTKPKYKFASTMPSCFRKGGKRKKKVLRSGIKKSLAHRESIRRKLLNSISSLITGCSTLARPTPPLSTSTSCPGGWGALFLITQPLALSSWRSRRQLCTQTLLHLSPPKVAGRAASPGHNGFTRSPRTLFKMPHVAAPPLPN